MNSYYEIYQQGDWYLVKDKEGATVWMEKSLDQCQEAITSGLIDQSIEMCNIMCNGVET